MNTQTSYRDLPAVRKAVNAKEQLIDQLVNHLRAGNRVVEDCDDRRNAQFPVRSAATTRTFTHAPQIPAHVAEEAAQKARRFQVCI
jgi:hypothetical protein